MLELIQSKDMLSSYLSKNKRQKKHIFYDIETLTVNQKTKQPSKLKSLEYIVSVSFLYEDKVHFFFMPNLTEFIRYLMQLTVKCKVELTAHNGNGYDNHFMLRALKNIGYKETNMFRDVINANYQSDKCENGFIESLRVKRKSSLSCKFMIGNVTFETTDTYMKSNASLATLGRKLLASGFIEEEYTKLEDFDYELYNKQYDMSIPQLQEYCKEVYSGLNKRQLEYCRNDVVILALYYYHYPQLYPGYDYNKMTLSQNIAADYDTNPLAKLQLRNIFYTGDTDDKSYREKKRLETHIKYSDFMFNGVNIYTYIKASYSGGLNLYNDKYVAMMIDRTIKYFDLNSAYPFNMATCKMPTFLTQYGDRKSLDNFCGDDDNFYIFRMDIDDFNNMVLDVKSHFMKCAFVKYLYKGKEDITINSNNLLLFRDFGVDLSQYYCKDYIGFECHKFGSAETIKKFYRVKQQARHKTVLDMTDVQNIKVTDIPLDKMDATEEEIYLYKVSMNGISGVPALRSTYPVYLLSENGQIEGYPNGFINKERNCVFSCFTTSRNFWNLLKPLKNLTAEEIDKFVYYTDTDSVIVDDAISHKLDMDMDHDNLGAWDIEHEITKLYIANNKMYTFETKEGEIKVKSCGVKKDIFSKYLYPKEPECKPRVPFEIFVRKFFKIGSELPNLKHVINEMGTISLYEAKTVIKHPVYLLYEQIDGKVKELQEKIKKEVREHYNDRDYEDAMYIESSVGVFSIAECFGDINDEKTEGRSVFDLVNIYKIAKLFIMR